MQNVMAFYLPDVQPAVWIAVFFVLTVLMNFLAIRRYGEIEYWLMVIKSVTILGLIILGVVRAIGTVGTPSLGTSPDGQPMKCQPSQSCREPGFSCIIFTFTLNRRLA